MLTDELITGLRLQGIAPAPVLGLFALWLDDAARESEQRGAHDEAERLHYLAEHLRLNARKATRNAN